MANSEQQGGQLDAVRVAKLMEGIGRCLAIYQRIEVSLKLLLPHMAGPGNQQAMQSMQGWRVLLDSKETLGSLMRRYVDNVNSEDPSAFASYLEQLVSQRNELVHHFFSLPIGKIETDAELELAIEHIRGLLKFASPFAKALREIVVQFAAAIEQVDDISEPSDTSIH